MVRQKTFQRLGGTDPVGLTAFRAALDLPLQLGKDPQVHVDGLEGLGAGVLQVVEQGTQGGLPREDGQLLPPKPGQERGSSLFLPTNRTRNPIVSHIHGESYESLLTRILLP